MSALKGKKMSYSINESENSTTVENSRNSSKLIKSGLLSGMVMSVIAVIIWFLHSNSVRSVGATVLIATTALVFCDVLILTILNNQRRKWKICTAVILTLLNATLIFSVTVYVLAPTQLFYPHFDKESYEELKTCAGTEELTVRTGNGSISGWMLHNAENSAPLVLYFCGNGENASARMLKIIDEGRLETFTGCNIAIFDYPGYGKTAGSPSEKTLKDFGLSAFDTLAQRADVDKGQIIVFGYSLGTGVADYVASKRDVAGLILMAPYSDGYDLYNGMINIFHGPLRMLVAFRMESIKFAQNVSVSPLILASTSDEMVNYNSSVRLSHAFTSGCTFQALKNTGHNDFWESETVLKYIAEYLAGVNAR
jgi:predicted alpha/beta hydrolase family esterase